MGFIANISLPEKESKRKVVRLLVVDDGPDIVAALKKGLEINGFSVEAYTDSVKALENIKRDNYDVIILDIHMAKMNGFELYRRMYRIDNRPAFCFFTAFEIYESEFRKMFPATKASLFIKKPIGASELTARIDKLNVR